jgi:hypothetical protein
MPRLAAAIVALLAATACTEPRSATCRSVCAREANCHDELDTEENFDEGECLDACAALERDDQTAELVERHAACVFEATSCTGVVDCQANR